MQVYLILKINLFHLSKKYSSSTSGGGSSSGGGGGEGSSTGRPVATVSYKTYNFAGTISLPDNEAAENDIPVTISICGTDMPESSEALLFSASSSSGTSSGGGICLSSGGGSINGGIAVAVQNVNAVYIGKSS